MEIKVIVTVMDDDWSIHKLEKMVWFDTFPSMMSYVENNFRIIGVSLDLIECEMTQTKVKHMYENGWKSSFP